jgi:hypothetical protein
MTEFKLEVSNSSVQPDYWRFSLKVRRSGCRRWKELISGGQHGRPTPILDSVRAQMKIALQAEPQPTQFEKLDQFARMIARMLIEGDKPDMGNGHVLEYSPEGNDAEVDALYGLIGAARELTGARPDGLVEE